MIVVRDLQFPRKRKVYAFPRFQVIQNFISLHLGKCSSWKFRINLSIYYYCIHLSAIYLLRAFIKDHFPIHFRLSLRLMTSPVFQTSGFPIFIIIVGRSGRSSVWSEKMATMKTVYGRIKSCGLSEQYQQKRGKFWREVLTSMMSPLASRFLRSFDLFSR